VGRGLHNSVNLPTLSAGSSALQVPASANFGNGQYAPGPAAPTLSRLGARGSPPLVAPTSHRDRAAREAARTGAAIAPEGLS
jgi:hypothetical protein